MQFSIFLLLFAFSCVYCKNHVKALTESMGQEVIEIGSPIKELPPGLDEEPSAESEEDVRTSVTSTKRETRKSTTLSTTGAQKLATANERRSNSLSDDEEKRIEKELADLYKDTDYKSESSKEVTHPPTTRKEVTTRKEDQKFAGRQGKGKVNFVFQPDVNDRADVERFRTSVDDISCEKRVTQRLQEMVSIVVLDQSGQKQQQLNDIMEEDNSRVTGSSSRLLRNFIAMCLAFLSTLVCQ